MQLKSIYHHNTEETNSALQNFRTAIDLAAKIVHFNRDGKITHTNRSFCELSGFEFDELQGIELIKLFPESENDNLQMIKNKLLNGESWQGEIKMNANRNKRIWFHATVVPIRNPAGQVRSYMAILDDITSNKIFEEEIINSENKYKQVVNSVKEVIFQIDVNGEITFLNQAWTDVTGFLKTDSLGLRLISFIHEEDVDKVEDHFKLLVSDKKDNINLNARFKNILGHYRWCDISERTLKDSSGKTLGISGTLNDVTEKRRNEELLLKSYSFYFNKIQNNYFLMLKHLMIIV